MKKVELGRLSIFTELGRLSISTETGRLSVFMDGFHFIYFLPHAMIRKFRD